ncbi:hypothetical protein ACFWM3_02370 [Gottfriedia sp. NPDC058432]|uniref:hypothetical protein n=1 Tax=unclassified Gottfriedia TaxID=2837516 RepID=UPI003665B9F6
MKSINLNQEQLKEILESFYKKGNEQVDIKTQDFVNEIIYKIQTLRNTNLVNVSKLK